MTRSTSSRTSSRDAVLVVLGEHRHEGLREGAFGEKAPENIRDLEGDEKGVHHEAGAEEARKDHVPDQAEDPRQQGHGRRRSSWTSGDGGPGHAVGCLGGLGWSR